MFESQVVAIKQIVEDAQMQSEQQLAFVREMSVLTQVRIECNEDSTSQVRHENLAPSQAISHAS